MVKKQKFLELEAVRGVAALMVTLYHFPTFSPIYENPVIRNGDLMVDLFFVISGFVISYNYFDNIGSSDKLVAFQKKRFWRLYPLHLLTFLVFVIIDLTRIVMNGESGESPESWKLALYNLLLVQALFADELSYNFPSWSISTEFLTYFVFACIAMMAGRLKSAIMLTMFVASAALCWHLDAFHNVVGYPILRCFYGFFAGVLVHRFYEGGDHRRYGWLLSPIIWSLVSIATMAFYDRLAAWLPVVIFSLLVASLAVHAGSSHMTNLLNSRFLQHLGKVSYSIYMWHIAIVFVFIRILQTVFGYGGEFVPNVGIKLDMGAGVASLVTMLYLLSIIVISSYSYHAVEMRFMKRKKA
ncbi:MAG: acyltransferase [Pseudomonadota bacterium]